MSFAPVYNCRKCGEVWKVYVHEHIDIERDEIIVLTHCSQCYSAVNPKIDSKGNQYMHPLTAEEIFWDNYNFDQEQF